MWHIDSWKNYISEQLPKYTDTSKLKLVEEILKQFDPLVNYQDIDILKNELGLALQKKAFVLQLGECAEKFIDCFNEEYISNFYNFFTELSNIIEAQLKLPVVKIGRIAGQFAKPRSSLVEKDNILAFRGEIINSYEFNKINREPNPDRMLLAYFSSKEAINLLRNVTKNDLNNIILSDIFSKKVYTSHEALLLNYEASLTREVNNRYYNLGAHMLWLGARTSSYPSPHIEYLRGISNPIGIKVHKDMSPVELINLVKLFNSSNEEGKVILIIRLSNNDMKNLLPLFIENIQKTKLKVLFMCDPMHGNTKKLGNYKVRYFDDLLENIIQFINICNKNGVYAGGLHLESTSLHVTECLGGEKQKVSEKDLHKNYKTTCDPRLNYNQTIEIISNILNLKLK